jgi:hypothetical protein
MARTRRIAHIDVIFRDSGKGRVRDNLGRYINRESKPFLRNEFMNLAYKGQAEVLARMADRYKRKETVTGRLQRVTADRRNRVYSDQGYGVGVIRWLDRSEAKYWRTIEEGSKAAWGRSFVGMELRGKFGGAYLGFRASSWGPRPIGGSPWNAYPGFFMPIRKMPALIVQNEIQPMNAYEDAFEGSGIFDKEPREVALQFVRDLARSSMLTEWEAGG